MDLMNGIKTIIFDFGGVIMNLDHPNAVRMFKKAGLENAEELLNPYHQQGIFQEFERGDIDRGTFYEKYRQLVGKEVPEEDIDAGWLGFVAGVEPYKLDMLDELRKKYAVFLLSNTNPVVMDWAYSPDFAKNGKVLSDYFDRLYISYELGCMKPDKAIFEHIIKDAGIDPAETLFVDDGESNCLAAAKLGFKTFVPKNREDFRYIFE